MTPVPPSSALKKLVELELGLRPGRLIPDFVAPRLGKGESVAAVAREISTKTGDLVTASTLGRWIAQDTAK